MSEHSISPHLVGRVFFALSAVSVAGLRDVHHGTYRKATRAGENPNSSTLGLKDHPTIKHPFCLLFDPSFSTDYLDPNVAHPTNLQHQDSEHKMTQRQSRGGRWADKVGVNRTISHCSKCGNDFEGKVEDMLICCPLAGMFQATRIAAHHLGTPKHGAALMRPKCVVVNISVPRCLTQACCGHFQTSLSASLYTERNLYVARLSMCAYFATHLDVFMYSTLWQFDAWDHQM